MTPVRSLTLSGTVGAAARNNGGNKMIADYRLHMHWRGLRPGSINARMSVLTRCQTAIGKPLSEASHLDLLGWLDGKHVHTRTRYTYISHLAGFYRWALIEGKATADPTLRVPRPKVTLGVPRPLTPDDVRTAIEQAPTPTLRAMLILAAYAGLRCMEIAGLEGSDVLDRHTPPMIVVSNGKGGRSRVVPVPPAVVDALAALGHRAHGPVFTRHGGGAMPPWKVSHMLREHLDACGIRASAHQLRHTYATQVLRESGGDLRMTQELLGHSSPTTTAIYAAWAQDRAADVVARLYGDAA